MRNFTLHSVLYQEKYLEVKANSEAIIATNGQKIHTDTTADSSKTLKKKHSWWGA